MISVLARLLINLSLISIRTLPNLDLGVLRVSLVCESNTGFTILVAFTNNLS